MVLWGSVTLVLPYPLASRLLIFMMIMFVKLLFFIATMELVREEGNRAS